MKTTKQERDFLAVQKYMESNPGTSTRAAIAEVAKKHKKSFGSVQVGYYKMLRRQSGAVATPPKKPKTTKKITTKPNNNLEHNLTAVKASLQDALRTIDMLEQQNSKNEDIINGLRKALTV
jgi:hypothetical protein